MDVHEHGNAHVSPKGFRRKKEARRELCVCVRVYVTATVRERTVVVVLEQKLTEATSPCQLFCCHEKKEREESPHTYFFSFFLSPHVKERQGLKR
jgi:hypothetical protein